MAIMGKTHIYVVARAAQVDAQQSSPDHYHKTSPQWTIMIEEHPLLGKSKVTEYYVTWDDTSDHFRVHQLDLGSHESILGSILISDSAHLSSSKAEADLRERYENKDALPADSDSEEWLRHALRAWQEEKILSSFDLGAFFTFAHSYIANRQAESSDTPGTVAYPKLHLDHEQKAKENGFWVSYAETAENKGGQKVYGGLM